MTTTTPRPTRTTRVTAEVAARAARTFYDCVDSGDVPGLAALFAVESSYHRPGYPPYLGREGMTRFYGVERTIREGRHALESVVAQDGEVAVCGSFRGVLHSGEPIVMRFGDFFVLDGDGLFTRRETFFCAPLA